MVKITVQEADETHPRTVTTEEGRAILRKWRTMERAAELQVSDEETLPGLCDKRKLSDWPHKPKVRYARRTPTAARCFRVPTIEKLWIVREEPETKKMLLSVALVAIYGAEEGHRMTYHPLSWPNNQAIRCDGCGWQIGPTYTTYGKYLCARCKKG